MSVLVPFPVSTVEEAREQPSLTYRLDLDRKRIIGRIDGIEAVEQFIRKAIITPRFKCLIYSNQWGSEVKAVIIAGDASPEYIESDMPRLVRDAVLVDSRVLDVLDFTFSLDGDGVWVKLVVTTIFGTVTVEEVI